MIEVLFVLIGSWPFTDNDTSNGGENVPDLPLMYRARHNSIESTNQFNVKPKMKLSNTIAAVVSEEEE